MAREIRLERIRMNEKIIASLTLITTLLLATFLAIPETSAGGPATTNMLIKIFFDPSSVEYALGSGDIDINDCPLSSTFINTHATDPSITLDQYAGMDMFQFDMNNQLWPTGPITSPRTGAKNNFFNPDGVRDIAAWHFRRALAHLANKDKYVTVYLGGYGYVLECDIPYPLCPITQLDLENATAVADAGPGGYRYPYDRAAAIAEFDLGGFRDYDGDTYREWRDPGADGIYGTGDDGPIEELPNMKFWIRLDHRQRWLAGEDLFDEMTLYCGIPVAAAAGAPGLDKRVAARSTCFSNVMVAYDYNIYTGDWSPELDFDFLFDLYHSSMGQYAFANNYPGFKNAEFDEYVERVKYAPTMLGGFLAAIEAQWVKAKYIPIIPLWSSMAVKGYRTGWSDVINEECYGVDNSWSFLGMNWIDGTGTTRNGPADTIVWGFSSDLSSLNVITATVLWDWKVLDLIYDSLLDRNPYNPGEEIGRLATAWSSTNSYPGWEGKTVCTYTVRTDALFHDGSPVKPADVAYSILCVKAAGAGNAWNYPTVMDVNKVEIQGQVVRVFFNVQSAFALHWSGFLPIINKDLWDDAIGVGTPSGYTGFIPDDTNGVYYPGSYADPTQIRAYHPWESTAAGDPAKKDLSEDGGWIYSFVSYAVGNNVTLNAFANMYTTMSRGGTMMTFSDFLNMAFHGVGNVNYPGGYGVNAGWYTTDRQIDIYDREWITRSLPSFASQVPWGLGWSQYNPDADVNYDGTVNIMDLVIWTIYYGKKMG